jgi:mono/diheme cytochrome c family protein
MQKITFLLLLVLAISLAACGGQSAPTGGGGDAAAGQTIFNQVASPPCSSCHSVEAGKRVVGPSLAGLGASADFLHQSIVDPNAQITEGFGANIMPTTYGSQLTEQQINDLVAYLMSLK